MDIMSLETPQLLTGVSPSVSTSGFQLLINSSTTSGFRQFFLSLNWQKEERAKLFSKPKTHILNVVCLMNFLTTNICFSFLIYLVVFIIIFSALIT